MAVDRGWSSGSKTIFLRTDTGLFLVLGGVIHGSSEEFGFKPGQHVQRGDSLGRVLGSYGMILFETYVAVDRTTNSPWWQDKPPLRAKGRSYRPMWMVTSIAVTVRNSS